MPDTLTVAGRIRGRRRLRAFALLLRLAARLVAGYRVEARTGSGAWRDVTPRVAIDVAIRPRT